MSCFSLFMFNLSIQFWIVEFSYISVFLRLSVGGGVISIGHLVVIVISMFFVLGVSFIFMSR